VQNFGKRFSMVINLLGSCDIKMKERHRWKQKLPSDRCHVVSPGQSNLFFSADTAPSSFSVLTSIISRMNEVNCTATELE